MNDLFVTIDDVSKALKVTRQTIAKYINSGQLKAIKTNKQYRISQKDLENYLKFTSKNSEDVEINIKKSKNCVLTYEGKGGVNQLHLFPADVSIIASKQEHEKLYNQFYFGDNLEVLKRLLPTLKGKVDLIYIDPPFGTGQIFTDMENSHAYSDKITHHNFLEFLRQRLMILREILSDKGSIYLHIDKKIGHYVKVIMDEVFGFDNFINDITRIKCNPKNFARNAYGNFSDIILFYAKEKDNNIWNEVKEELNIEQLKKLFPKMHKLHGPYTTHPIHAPGETLNGDTGKEWKGMMPPKGRHWRYSREELNKLDKQGLIEWSENGNPRKIVFAKDHAGTKTQDVWEYKDKGSSYNQYPTQKNSNLLTRIILNSSNPSSIVLDCFAGSGSTLLAADSLGRQWIGIDNSPLSLKVVGETFKKEKILCNYFSLGSVAKETPLDICQEVTH